MIVCFPCLFIEYVCNIEDHQEELGQGEGFVDQGQEQEQVAEGKPFIHAFPMHPCLLTCIFSKVLLFLCHMLVAKSYGLARNLPPY